MNNVDPITQALHSADPSKSEEEIETTLAATFTDSGAFQRECRGTLATSQAEFLSDTEQPGADDGSHAAGRPPPPGAGGPRCEVKEAAKMAKKCARAVSAAAPEVAACFKKPGASTAELCVCLAMEPLAPCLGECRSQALQFVCSDKTLGAVLSLWDIAYGEGTPDTPLCVASLIAARFEAGPPVATVAAPASAIGAVAAKNRITVPSTSRFGGDGGGIVIGKDGEEEVEEEAAHSVLHYSTRNAHRARGRGQGESTGEVKRTEPIPAWLAEPLASMLHPELNPTAVFTVEELIRRAKAYAALDRSPKKRRGDGGSGGSGDQDGAGDHGAAATGIYAFTAEHEVVTAEIVGRLIELGIVVHAGAAGAGGQEQSEQQHLQRNADEL